MKKNGYSVNIGDEGGLAPELKSNKQALDLLEQAIEKSGYIAGKDIFFALDIAATELYDGKNYQFKGEGKVELMRLYNNILGSYKEKAVDYLINRGNDNIKIVKHNNKSNL